MVLRYHYNGIVRRYDILGTKVVPGNRRVYGITGYQPVILIGRRNLDHSIKGEDNRQLQDLFVRCRRVYQNGIGPGKVPEAL
jgi:hypothetical protein